MICWPNFPGNECNCRRGGHRSTGRLKRAHARSARPRRRGVLLLVVLSLLSLLAVVVITFVVVSGLKKQSATTIEKVSRYDTPPKALLDDVMLQLLRGTNSPNSALQGHDLLGDLYGEDGVAGLTIPAPEIAPFAATPLPAFATAQVLEIRAQTPSLVYVDRSRLDLATNIPEAVPVDSLPKANSHQDGFFSGCLLTFLSGPFSGDSLRIVEYFSPASPVNPSGDVNTAIIRVELPRNFSAQQLAAFNTKNVVHRFYINGRPFNGTGQGFNAAQGALTTNAAGKARFTTDARVLGGHPIPATIPMSEQVNFANGTLLTPANFPALTQTVLTSKQYHQFLLSGFRNSTAGPPVNVLPSIPSLADEDYDAVDHQNMFLAMEATANNFSGAMELMPPSGKVVLVPSFWRPDLMHHVHQRLQGVGTAPFDASYIDIRGNLGVPETLEVWNRITLRPNPILHPVFAAANPRLNDPTLNAGLFSTIAPPSPTNLPTSPPLTTTQIYDPYYQIQSIQNPAGTAVFQPPPWDIDNDGDGLTDSVWIDPGLPVQTAADGRRYKVLAAVLCLDMDGRFNLNAHGSLLQAQLDATSEIAATQRTVSGNFHGGAGTLQTPSSISLAPPVVATGSGMGPADIRLSVNTQGIIPAPSAPFANQPVLMSGQAALQLLGGRDLGVNGIDAFETVGRYGAQNPLTAASTAPAQFRVPGQIGLDATTRALHNQFPVDLSPLPGSAPLVFDYVFGFKPNGYGTPWDLRGAGVFALDHRGQPLYRGMGGWNDNPTAASLAADNQIDTVQDNPYEIRLAADSSYSARTRVPGAATSGDMRLMPKDDLFTPAELERLLRFYDQDAKGLPERLLTLTRVGPVATSLPSPFEPFKLPGLGAVAGEEPGASANVNIYMNQALLAGKNRASVTTESADLPAPSLAVPRFLRQQAANLGLPQPQHIVDMLRLRIELANSGNPTFSTVKSTPADLETYMNNSIRYLLAPELIAGKRLNLNRPFGDGMDNNGNGVVDEPSEAIDGIDNDGDGDTDGVDNDGDGVIDVADEELNGYVVFNSDNIASVATRVPFMLTTRNEFLHPNPANVLNAPTTNAQRANAVRFREQNARQLMARYLYTLAMMLCEPTFDVTQESGETSDAEARARLLAQWAINVVDFRDRDHIMTAFEYDVNPFVDDNTGDPVLNPWNVDGDLTTDDGDPTGVFRRVVWGAERPEMLITETMATHDRRTKEDPPTSGTHVQNRRPVGTLLVELFNPWSPSDAPSGDVHSWMDGANPNISVDPPSSFAANGAPEYGVDLARLDPSNTSPLWRIVTGRALDPANLPSSQELAILDPTNTTTKMDRVAYLGYVASTAAPNEGLPAADDVFSIPNFRRFAAQKRAAGNRPLPVRPDHYAVIATGEKEDWSTPQDVWIGRNDPATYTSAQALRFTSGGSPDVRNLRTALTDFTAAATNSRKPVVGFLIAPLFRQAAATAFGTDQPTATPVAGDRKLRWSISEADQGIQYPGGAGISFADDELDWPSDPTWSETDEDADRVQAKSDSTIQPNASDPNNAARMVYLQRLANPLQPWNELTNPYITIDMYPVDLHLYNGDDNTSPNPGNLDWGSRERGTDSIADHNAWRRELTLTAPNSIHTAPALDSPTALNQDQITGTFGYLNKQMGGQTRFDSVTSPNSLNDSAHAGDEDYLGDHSTKPSPWFTWNDRPFNNAQELLLVPLFSGERMLREHGEDKDGAPTAGKPYDPPTSNQSIQGEFAHLPGMLASKNHSTAPSAAFPELGRLLDYVAVPTLFPGSEDVLSPVALAGDFNLGLAPPFNTVSRFREVGKVNINTVFNPDVWQGVTSGLSSTTYANLVQSRRGYNSPLLNGLPANPAESLFPSVTSNPYRSFAGGMLQPVVDSSTTPPLDMDLTRRDVDGTLLRPRGALAGIASSDHPLLGRSDNVSHSDAERNPYFRYQGLQKLGANLTTRSNVYAVWITVGYFEVTPASENPAVAAAFTLPQIQALYPDNWQIGAELGSDTGEIQRHRAFYMIDRTRPVAYRKGEDYNVRDCLLVDRFIE